MEYRICNYIPVSDLYFCSIYGSVPCYLVRTHPLYHKHGSKVKKEEMNLGWKLEELRVERRE